MTKVAWDLWQNMKHSEKLGVQQRVEEFSVVAGVLLALQPRHILEIGVYGGGSFALWCSLASGTKIGIDSGNIDGPIHHRMPDFQARFGDVRLIKANSQDAATLEQVKTALAGEPLDFLFIDGDHTLQGVQKDYSMYGALVRPGGWIGLHDITESDYHKGMNAGGSAEHWARLDHPRKISLDWHDPGYGIGLVQVI
jgi:cephalosporin hydroxylase